MNRFFVHRFFCLFILTVMFTGIASAGKTEKIGIKAKLTVHLYDSVTELHDAYVNRGGDQKIMKKIKGFYSDRDNSIHCIKWDFYTCGHELYHALQYKGDRPIFVEKDFKHFKENNYAGP